MSQGAARDASSNHANSAASAASTGTTNNKEKHRNVKITNTSMKTVCDYIMCSVHMYINAYDLLPLTRVGLSIEHSTACPCQRYHGSARTEPGA